jgi:hypothetical protein
VKKIYVASSWRNEEQPAVVAALRAEGYEVYDFHNPAPGEHGFAWSEIDPNWRDWTPLQFFEALSHPIAVRGFHLDMNALWDADATVLVMPCGNDAHLELGYAVGAGQKTVIYWPTPFTPELMASMAHAVCATLPAVVECLRLLLDDGGDS